MFINYLVITLICVLIIGLLIVWLKDFVYIIKNLGLFKQIFKKSISDCENKFKISFVRLLILPIVSAAIISVVPFTSNISIAKKNCSDRDMDLKPAIYLYPDKEQKIEIQLDKSIKYINTIPNYHKGWVVMAKPTGILYDLQPQYTDCEMLPYNEFGFEYSKDACEHNVYPYIFWDGIQILKPLPKKEEGFIVENSEIENFLYDKAEILKLNKNEKAEFVSFWTYKMKEKNYDKFRVYFLQNEEVDKYLPIKVSPKPKSSNRVQIIISQAQDDEQAEEQILLPVFREGYTLVEWGGVIQ